jgi:hypothetical protein
MSKVVNRVEPNAKIEELVTSWQEGNRGYVAEMVATSLPKSELIRMTMTLVYMTTVQDALDLSDMVNSHEKRTRGK